MSFEPDKTFSSFINSDHKQHLNLIPSAWAVIDNDRRDFSKNTEPLGLATLLNKIILTCETNPELLPYPVKLLDEKNEYIKANVRLLCEHALDPQIKDLKNNLAEQYEKNKREEIRKKSKKGESRKFRLSDAVYDEIDQIKETDIRTRIFEKPGAYLKVLLEEYAKLPASERERIYFYEMFETLQEIIKNRQTCTLCVAPSDNSFLVKPYEITADTLLTHLYLSGYSAANPTNHPYDFKPASFRISRISKKPKVSENFEDLLTPEEIRELEKQLETKLETNFETKLKRHLEAKIKERGIAFLLSESTTAKVKFTENGLWKLQSQSYLRPVSIEKESELVYLIKATELQLEAYFLKFGKDVEILEPAKLRERFARHYQDAAALYSCDTELLT